MKPSWTRYNLEKIIYQFCLCCSSSFSALPHNHWSIGSSWYYIFLVIITMHFPGRLSIPHDRISRVWSCNILPRLKFPGCAAPRAFDASVLSSSVTAEIRRRRGCSFILASISLYAAAHHYYLNVHHSLLLLIRIADDPHIHTLYLLSIHCIHDSTTVVIKFNIRYTH